MLANDNATNKAMTTCLTTHRPKMGAWPQNNIFLHQMAWPSRADDTNLTLSNIPAVICKYPKKNDIIILLAYGKELNFTLKKYSSHWPLHVSNWA